MYIYSLQSFRSFFPSLATSLRNKTAKKNRLGYHNFKLIIFIFSSVSVILHINECMKHKAHTHTQQQQKRGIDWGENKKSERIVSKFKDQYLFCFLSWVGRAAAVGRVKLFREA